MSRQVDLSAYRHATWGGQDSNEEVIFLGEDLADATFVWAFAAQPGGERAFMLENAGPGEQGLCARYEASMCTPGQGS